MNNGHQIRSFINSHKSPVCGPVLALRLENSAETSFIASEPGRNPSPAAAGAMRGERRVITDTFKCGHWSIILIL